MGTVPMVNIDARILKLLGPGRVFNKDNTARINSIDFHRKEDLLITGADDDSIHLYNTATGELQEVFFSKKYGVANIVLTHSPYCALYATRKPAANSQEYPLRYHDLRRNEYLRYYKGHTGPITTIAMSPKADALMSASLDKTVRLWDLRTSICQGMMQVPGTPTAVYDEQGLVFAVATESGIIKLYDVRSYDKGPFITFAINDEINTPSSFSDLRFSNDGKWILGVVESKIYVLDAFSGNVVNRFSNGASPDSPYSLEAAFTPDSQFIVAGCEDRTIRAWAIDKTVSEQGGEGAPPPEPTTSEPVAVWQAHAGIPSCVKFAPRRMLMASACQALVLWIPPLQVAESR